MGKLGHSPFLNFGTSIPSRVSTQLQFYTELFWLKTKAWSVRNQSKKSFSHAWRRLHVFPRFSPVAFYPALGAIWMFYLRVAFHCVSCVWFYSMWLTRLVTCTSVWNLLQIWRKPQSDRICENRVKLSRVKCKPCIAIKNNFNPLKVHQIETNLVYMEVFKGKQRESNISQFLKSKRSLMFFSPPGWFYRRCLMSDSYSKPANCAEQVMMKKIALKKSESQLLSKH